MFIDWQLIGFHRLDFDEFIGDDDGKNDDGELPYAFSYLLAFYATIKL